MIQSVDWYIAPLLNPDGYEYTHTDQRLWRKNRFVTSLLEYPYKYIYTGFPLKHQSSKTSWKSSLNFLFICDNHSSTYFHMFDSWTNNQQNSPGPGIFKMWSAFFYRQYYYFRILILSNTTISCRKSWKKLYILYILYIFLGNKRTKKGRPHFGNAETRVILK